MYHLGLCKMNTYLFDTENKRAVRHSNMLLECINKSKQQTNTTIMNTQDIKKHISTLSLGAVNDLYNHIFQVRNNLLQKEDEKLEPIPDYGDLFTIKYFKSMVKDGSIMDDDGCGYYATETHMSRVNCFSQRPSWATHVVWFNK